MCKPSLYFLSYIGFCEMKESNLDLGLKNTSLNGKVPNGSCTTPYHEENGSPHVKE